MTSALTVRINRVVTCRRTRPQRTAKPISASSPQTNSLYSPFQDWT